MNNFNMALIQMDCKFLDVSSNLHKAEQKVREAAGKGAQFACLPEGFNTGYYCFEYEKMREVAEPIHGESITKMRYLAKELKIHILAPIMLIVGTGIIENTAILIDDEGVILGSYSKTHLVGQEQLYLQRGRKYPIFNTKFGKIGIVICYDICFPETTRLLTLEGADLIICPAAWRDGSYFKDWLNKVSAVRALDNNIYVAVINRVGTMPNSPFCGCTQIIDPIGNVLGMCSSDKEEILYQDIDMRRVYQERMNNTVLIDRHPEDYSSLGQ